MEADLGAVVVGVGGAQPLLLFRTVVGALCEAINKEAFGVDGRRKKGINRPFSHMGDFSLRENVCNLGASLCLMRKQSSVCVVVCVLYVLFGRVGLLIEKGKT